MKVLLVSLFDEWCLGLRALSAYLKQHGHETHIAYLRGMPEMHDEAGKDDPDGFHAPPGSVSKADFDALATLARDTDPGLIGLSLTSNFFGLAVKTAAVLREACPAAPIVWGGIDPTANPDLAVRHADYVCIGEGEGAMLELVEGLEAGSDCDGIPNLCVLRDGTMRSNPVRPLIQDLDALPWADFDTGNKSYIHNGHAVRDGLPEGSYLLEEYPMLSGRGCPYSCTYCCNSMLRDLYGNKGYVRQRSVRNIVDEIKHAIDRDARIGLIDFHDDVFGTKESWLREFADTYRREVGLPFYCYVHASASLERKIPLLKRAGVEKVRLGIQSGSERILRDVYGRHTSREDILTAVRALHEARITTIIDLISGNPLETDEDRLATLDLMLELPPGFAMHPVNTLGVYRNYPIAQIFEREGVLEPWLDHRNATRSPETPEMRFWHAILALPVYPELDRAAIRTMAGDPYLKEHPEGVEAVCTALERLTYCPGTMDRRDVTEAAVMHELGALKGSRLVRGAMRVREWLGRLRG